MDPKRWNLSFRSSFDHGNRFANKNTFLLKGQASNKRSTYTTHQTVAVAQRGQQALVCPDMPWRRQQIV